MEFSQYSKGTAAVWAGEEDVSGTGAVTSPITNSVAFAYTDLDEWHNVSLGKAEGYIYSRNTNPIYFFNPGQKGGIR
jgi:cystathionine gamma-synthase